MQSTTKDSPQRYITNLPSTPQMERYTAAPSAYTDPTVKASPPAWWGSSLDGCGPCGCGGCGGGLGALENMSGATVGILVAAAIAGYFLLK